MLRRFIVGGLLLATFILASCITSDIPTSADQTGNRPIRVPTSHYSSPTGSAAAPGTLEAPWDLETALSGGTNSNPVLAGDTVWLRGGDYIRPDNNGEFDVSVNTGTPAQPVVFREQPGDSLHAVLTRTSANSGFGAPGVTLNVSGQAQYTEFWDFEVTTLNASRSTTDPAMSLPDVISNYASHTKFVNLIIHDGGVGFLTEGANDATPAPVDLLNSGCIIYNYVWHSDNATPPVGSGHGLYLKSTNSPDLVVAGNVIFNGFGYGIQIYSDHGASLTSHIQVKENVLCNNGMLSTHGTSANLGNLGEYAGNNLLFDRNMLYYSPAIGRRNLIYRETGPPFQGEDTDPIGFNNTRRLNYVVGGTWPVEDGVAKESPNNPAAGWHVAAGEEDFIAAVPSGITYFVRKTAADPNRANLVIYGDGSPSTTVNLSAFLNNGDVYEIRNAQDFRAAVRPATYNGPIDVDLKGVIPPQPNGWTTPANTGPAFNVFVITRIGTAGSVTSAASAPLSAVAR